MNAERIDINDARAHTSSGDALLVCGYEDESRCRRIMLDGAISLGTFQKQLGTIPKDREIIFYCA